ncbi:ribbon-helix-helix domain-containing protein [Blastococcus mobilis]|uniref:ribbon-helix-helix domain-containing protein n=1 Tax=Blastococcus mobilis TaxID=1938746 RepID=UPI000B7977D9|nr:ribbon-helix-helix domain-containing protein [Blastococcus mobilis]
MGLRDIGLRVVGSSAATPAPLAHGWGSGDAEQTRQARLLVVGGYLAALLTARPDTPWVADPLDMVLPILAAAALDRPLPATQTFRALVRVTLPAELLVDLDREAGRRGSSRSAVLATAARRELEQHDPAELDAALERARAAMASSGSFEAADLVRAERHR